MTASLCCHASCVAVGQAGLLIKGSSGSGKSSLALSLMALGAELVADDRTDLHVEQDRLIASCPATIRGRIEARGIGILAATPREHVSVVAVVDMDETETDRLPPARSIDILGQTLPLLYKAERVSFAAALLQYLRGARCQ